MESIDNSLERTLSLKIDDNHLEITTPKVEDDQEAPCIISLYDDGRSSSKPLETMTIPPHFVAALKKMWRAVWG